MATVGRIQVLLLVDILAIYTMYVMMVYLTNVWKLDFTHAAAILNIFWGVVSLSPVLLAFIADTIIGNYWMLLISSIAYSVGLGFLTMSTPPVLGHSTGTCSEYKPERIGEEQKILFYAALCLIALGMSGQMASWQSFTDEQLGENQDNYLVCRTHCGFCFGLVVACVVVFGLPFVKPWSLRFGIPAISALVATLLFLSGSCFYKYSRPAGSPLKMFVRVFVAAASKLFYKTPSDAKELYEFQSSFRYSIPHKRSLRCLDKAAIVMPTKSVEEQEKNLWTLCRVTEVEETKNIIRLIPVSMTFILCGVVSAIGFTFFVEQLDHLNHKVGSLNVPIIVLLWFYVLAIYLSPKLYAKFANSSGSRKFAPLLGIAISMILAILCCITAAIVENRRLGVVQKHGLVDKPDETVPMTMFWLLPQFILLGASSEILNKSAISLITDKSPVATQRYVPFFVNGVQGLGVLSSVLSVFVVGKLSERGGKINWFQHNLNGSRLDKYYWTLAWLMAINLVIFIVVAIFYRYKESELEDQQGAECEPYDDNSKCFCCSC